MFLGFAVFIVYLLLTSLHGCGYDVGASKNTGGTQVRNVRNDLFQLVDDGYLATDQLARMALLYMSVADLEDMIRSNDLASYLCQNTGFQFSFSDS